MPRPDPGGCGQRARLVVVVTQFADELERIDRAAAAGLQGPEGLQDVTVGDGLRSVG